METNVFILESLVKTKTGTLLYNNINRLKNHPYKNIISHLYSISTKEDIVKAFEDISIRIKKENINIIDIEAHGIESSEGFFLSSGKIVSWQDIIQLLEEINLKSNNSLVVFLSFCNGEIPKELLNKQWCKYLLYNDGILLSNDLVCAQQSFFECLLLNNDIEKAVSYMIQLYPKVLKMKTLL